MRWSQVSVAVTAYTAVSTGATRLFGGGDDGRGSATRLAIVVGVGVRLTDAASGSVPVFTDQRASPHEGFCLAACAGGMAPADPGRNAATTETTPARRSRTAARR